MDPLALYTALFLLAMLSVGLAIYVYFLRTEVRGPINTDVLLNTIEDPIAVLDADETVLVANLAFRRLFGDEPGGQSLAAVLDPSIYDGVRTDQSETVTIETPQGTRRFQIREYLGGGGRRNEQRRVLLFQDVTDRAAEIADLERENERLEQFASFISHDLRNPLDVAIGRTNALMEMVDEPSAIEQLEETQDAHRRMRRLITDVLALAREGNPTVQRESVDLEAIARRSWSQVETNGAAITVTGSATLRADPYRIQGIFENLFRNAIEHGDPEVSIRIGTLDDGEGFFVADDGVGIPEEERETVTEAGYSTRKDGTGLGLSIVRRIADAHGWGVTITESSDGGARFEFRGVEVVAEGLEASGSE